MFFFYEDLLIQCLKQINRSYSSWCWSSFTCLPTLHLSSLKKLRGTLRTVQRPSENYFLFSPRSNSLQLLYFLYSRAIFPHQKFPIFQNTIRGSGILENIFKLIIRESQLPKFKGWQHEGHFWWQRACHNQMALGKSRVVRNSLHLVPSIYDQCLSLVLALQAHIMPKVRNP